MNDTFIQSLQIALLGMGLVFAAILLLWAIMAAMTALFRERETPTPLLKGEEAGSEGNIGGAKARAAAIAVAVALAAQRQSSAHPLPEPPTAIVSAWQLGMRTRQMSQKGNLERRKR
jgi:Na+-transporting methylmalonyl-CoA/oxaloacetate decarboxylase gamma subunit